MGWCIGKNNSFKDRISPFKTYRDLEEDGLTLGKFGKVFAFMVKFVGPLLIIFIEIFGIIDKVNTEGSHYWWVIGFSVLMLIISIVVYFVFFEKRETGTNQDEFLIDEKAKEQA